MQMNRGVSIMKLKFIKGPILLITILCFLGISGANAEKTAKVSGKYTYVLTENDDVTIKQAKIKAIEMAKAEAIRTEFGTLVASDFINTERQQNDDLSSYYLMDTSSSVKGEWLGDERDPEISIECVDGELHFTAEVWGTAREICRAATDIQWQIMKLVDNVKVESDSFDSGQRFFVKFRCPADGYIAIYLISGDNETSCLLPYRKDSSGRVAVKANKEYVFFDKALDYTASYYKLTTRHPQEYNQLVLIFSPNPFTKCLDTSGDSSRPNYLSQKDFAKWLLKNQRADNEMVVNRKWLTINGNEN